jgi:hypothetical protein
MLTTQFGDRVVVAGGSKFPIHRDQVVELLQALLDEAKELPSENYVGISINMTTREEALRSKSLEIILPQGEYIEMHLFKDGSPHVRRRFLMEYVNPKSKS